MQVIGKVMGMQPVYTRMPECAYVISNIKVSKTGEMIWDERTDAEQVAAYGEFLAALIRMAKEACDHRSLLQRPG